jgi:hypothetical protein
VNSDLILKKVKKNAVVREALSAADKYKVPDVNATRKEIKELMLFRTNVEKKTKLDIGFDLGFSVPNKDMTKLAELMGKNEQYRARAVEIFINLKKMHNRLSYLYDNSLNYILVEFGALFSSMTKEAKVAIVNVVFEDLLRNKSDIEELIDDIKQVISAMDSTHWTLKSIKEIGDGIIERTRV